MSNGMFVSLEAALSQVALKGKAKAAAEAAFRMATQEHDAALLAAQKLYKELQDALSPIVDTPGHFHP